MTTFYLNGIASQAPGATTLDTGPCDLRLTGIAKRYEDFSLEDVALDVPRGSVVGLVGRNGAGKTTLMKVVLGATLPEAGRIELFGQDVSALGSQELARLRMRVGYVSATVAYPSGMRASEVVRLYELAYPAFSRAEFERLCALMGLDSPRRKVSELSRGMGMKLQLACALATGADLLLLDEPTAGLDPIVREEVLDVLRGWMEDERHSMLVSSHITSDLEHIADYLVMIEQGRVVLACERDIISDIMGVAHLRSSELERVREAWPFGEVRMRVIDQGLHTSLLVPNRRVFREKFDDFACDRASIDDVMTFIVKGEVI